MSLVMLSIPRKFVYNSVVVTMRPQGSRSNESTGLGSIFPTKDNMKLVHFGDSEHVLIAASHTTLGTLTAQKKCHEKTKRMDLKE